MLSLQEAIDLAHTGSARDLANRFSSYEEMEEFARQVIQVRETAQRENQLLFYQPVNEDARAIHLSTAKQIFTLGGNRSSKTDTHLAELAIQMTGIVPFSLRDDYPKEKLRAPIRARLVCESLTNTWDIVIKPKLQWNQWSGREPRGGPNGHWGWIPKSMLIRGKWDESWTEKNRMLTLANGSTLQVMSYDQDLQDFSGGSFHIILCDEGPPANIYRENRMRTIDVQGRLMTAMTPPDDESKAWHAAWIADEYEKGQAGPKKDPRIDSFTLWTEKNRILVPEDIQEVFKDLTPLQKLVRGKGQFIHLSGLIYPMYTHRPQMWCFKCNQATITNGKLCLTCQSDDTVEFCHLVEPFELAYTYPCIFLIDPHPRKPVMMAWVTVDVTDDWWQVHELEINGDPEAVRDAVLDFEREKRLNVVRRVMDPKMAGQAAHNAGKREISVKEEYDAVGLRCAAGDSGFDVGMKRLRTKLKPDSLTRSPGLHIFNHCTKTDYQFRHYVWDEWQAHSETKDPKAMPITKNDDFPTLLKYLANESPTHVGLYMGGQTIRATKSKRKGAY